MFPNTPPNNLACHEYKPPSLGSMEEFSRSVDEQWKRFCQTSILVSEDRCNKLSIVIGSIQHRARAWKFLASAFTNPSLDFQAAKRVRRFLELTFGKEGNPQKQALVRCLPVTYLVAVAAFFKKGPTAFYRCEFGVIQQLCDEARNFIEDDLIARVFQDAGIRTSCRAPSLYSPEWVNFLQGCIPYWPCPAYTNSNSVQRLLL